MVAALGPFSWPDVTATSMVEVVVRSAAVYLLLFLIFRLASRRELAQATLFDFLTVLLIANVVQNSMIGNDTSVFGGIAGALTLYALSSLLGRLTARSHRAQRLLEGQPLLLVKDGTIQHNMMRQQAVSHNDLLSAIRKQGFARLADVDYAILELDGSISVVKADKRQRPHDCLPKEVVGEESAEI
ncbi:MAG: DUF421 domain-containing protein [Dehalococcoidia bacterium]